MGKNGLVATTRIIWATALLSRLFLPAYLPTILANYIIQFTLVLASNWFLSKWF